MKQLRGHYEFESSNTLRNSVLPVTIPKADRFKLEKMGSYFVELKDPGATLTNATQSAASGLASITAAKMFSQTMNSFNI